MGKEKPPAGEGKWPTLGKMETYCKKKEGGPSLLSPFSGAHGLIDYKSLAQEKFEIQSTIASKYGF